MQAASQKTLADAVMKERLLSKFLQIADYRTGAEVDKQLQAELAHWGPVIKASGFTPAP
jgi:tripartite-type tricarboxylate transporter receptor subunit TctC